MGAPTSLADTPTRHGSAPARLAGVPTSLADPRMNLYGWVDEARRRPDEARWFTDEARWHTRETRRCASEARWRARVLHGSTSQCSWVHLRASRTGVSGSLASGRVSSEHRTTLMTAENASKGPGQSFEGEAKGIAGARPSEVRHRRRYGTRARHRVLLSADLVANTATRARNRHVDHAAGGRFHPAGRTVVRARPRGRGDARRRRARSAPAPSGASARRIQTDFRRTTRSVAAG
jgi:hypothetical protein